MRHVLMLLQMMLLVGPAQLVCWLNLLPFLGALHWAVRGDDLGGGCVSYLE